MGQKMLLLIGMSALLVACGRQSSVATDRHGGGRYEGIGIATPGDAWTKLADAPKPSSDKLATLRDDDYVVFVTDTKTGEVRECGDRSGFCIQLRPWDKPAPSTPLTVTEHTKHKGDTGAGETISNEAMAAE